MKFNAKLTVGLKEQPSKVFKLYAIDYYSDTGIDEKEVLEHFEEIALENGYDISGYIYDDDYEIEYSNLY